MVTIGTPLKSKSTKVLICGSGELGKELVVEFQKYGIETIAIDKYENAPAMQVSHKKYVLNMLDEKELKDIVYLENPLYIIPEIEAINIKALIDLENQGYKIIPSSKTIFYTMDRENIRNLVRNKLKIKTSNYIVVKSFKEFKYSIKKIGYPCISKPTMSSSGKGQYVINSEKDIKEAWIYSKKNTRGLSKKIIIEEYINFDYEITLLTIKTSTGIMFCNPIGHQQINGDYRKSWQPQKMKSKILDKIKK